MTVVRMDFLVRPGRLLAVAALTLLTVVPTACSPADAPVGRSASPSAAAESPSPQPMPSYAMGRRVPRPTPDKVMLGAYLDLNGLSQARSIALRRQQLGRDLRIMHWFYKWNDPLPSKFSNLPRDAVVLLSWDGTRYDRVLNGSQDRQIRASARNLAKYGKPIFLRWAWEMNGDWYDWGGARNGRDPAAFVRAWRHIHDIFVKAGATNVGWVWGPNWQSGPREAWNDLRNYYPGDEYVDWVGVSGYTDATRLTPEVLYTGIYQEYADRKPIMIAETGVRKKGGQQSADWIDLLRQWLDSHRAVGAVVWFDTNTHARGTDRFTDFRIDRDPAMLAAYQRLAGDPRFAG